MKPIEPMCVGEFCECVQIIYGLPGTVDYSGNLDAALFKVTNSSKVSSMQRDRYDTPSEYADVDTDMLVQKVGRSTGLTSGKVVVPASMRRNIKYRVREQDFAGEAWFDDIFVVEGTTGKFADFGDSGSLIVAKSPDGGKRVAVGMVFAVQDQLTYAMPITHILNRLRVTLVSGHNV
jgi:hypothetical protein